MPVSLSRALINRIIASRVRCFCSDNPKEHLEGFRSNFRAAELVRGQKIRTTIPKLTPFRESVQS